MRPSIVLVVSGVVAACSSGPIGGTAGDDGPAPGDSPTSAGTTCSQTSDCPFGQRCYGGLCTTDIQLPTQGCLDDSECPANFACAPSTGTCVQLAEEVEPPIEVPVACLDGESRPCGIKVGMCQYGVQRCVAGTWETACTGGIAPATAELCNGLDDICDGVVPANEADADGDGVRVCAGDCDDDPSGGACGADCFPGNPEVCDGRDNDCQNGIDDGTDVLCDDGLYCNGQEACVSGACGPGTPASCVILDDDCNIGVCDEPNDGCLKQPRADGIGCDDGLYCTVNDSCAAGTCTGQARDCTNDLVPLALLECNLGVCDEGIDDCVPDPVPFDGVSCDDGQICTVNEVCTTGACGSGDPVVCADTGCRSGACVEPGGCTAGTPINEGGGCNDNIFCTVTDTCIAGDCIGVPRDCFAAVGDQCNDATCDEGLNVCLRDPTPRNDLSCDDGLDCTVGEKCQLGVCGSGTPMNCTALDGPCNIGACNETSGVCEPTPRSDGTPCNDTLYCTVNDGCTAGSCGGSTRDCSAVVDACNSASCNDVADQCEPSPKSVGALCSDGAYCTDGDACDGAGACQSGGPRDCSGLTDACNDGVCDDGVNSCIQIDNGLCICDDTIDADFDGSNECDDCDETNGSVYPGAPERCNGIDDDCDTLIDEDFDIDLDGYSVCAIDPLLFDCDDNDLNINPGMAEICGNAVDENCDGYAPPCGCTTTDVDSDGVNECDGDCDDNNPDVYPGAPELCDGVDNDCNTYTIENCDVSDGCNQDLDDDFSNDPDVCMDDLLCACIVNAAGNCTGNWQCTSYCNTSQTGPTGDGCTATQTCALDLLLSANVHGCDEFPGTPGNKFGGTPCSDDDECRSGYCARLFGGQGQKEYCYDYCGSDDYCPAVGTVCRLRWTGSNVDGRCWPDDRPGVGTVAVGSDCTIDGECDHGFCADEDDDGGQLYCSEACCHDPDCPNGFTCSLRGNQVTTSFVYPPPSATTCAVDTDCPTGMGCFNLTSGLICAWALSETAPMCLRDSAGQDTRRAGAACTQNSDCQSNFCEAALSVCVEVCCSDATCPNGLTCELQTVQTTADLATSSRVCVNLSTDEVLTRK